MRADVILDDALVEKAKALTGIKTTRAVIDEALRLLTQLTRTEPGARSARPNALGRRSDLAA